MLVTQVCPHVMDRSEQQRLPQVFGKLDLYLRVHKYSQNAAYYFVQQNALSFPILHQTDQTNGYIAVQLNMCIKQFINSICTLTLYQVIRCRQQGRQNILQALTTELYKVFLQNALVQPTMRFNVLGLKPQRVSNKKTS